MGKLVDPSNHPDWLQPHSVEWYQQVGKLHGKYQYPWNSVLEEPNGESLFDQEVLRMVKDEIVLDVGCGHGDFAIRCSSVAKEVTGFDITEQFIESGSAQRKKNVAFVVGNTKEGLPFERDEFDCAYIRKGPTSAYPLLTNVVKKGGKIMGLHPGDESGKELPNLFPNLFKHQSEKIIDVLEDRLKSSSFSKTEIQSVNSIEYLKAPIDIIKLCCFGQKETVFKMVMDQSLEHIVETYERLASFNGLAVTFSRYIVRAVV